MVTSATEKKLLLQRKADSPAASLNLGQCTASWFEIATELVLRPASWYALQPKECKSSKNHR